MFELLKRKYGGISLSNSINQGSRTVALVCSGGGGDLFISYYDSDLIDLAEKEEKKGPEGKRFKAEEIDPSGL